jgi:hypothetical protein
LLVQLRYDVMKFCPLTANAGQRELRLGLGEPHGWPLGPERWKPYGHSGYLRRLGAVHYLHAPSGSPMWEHAHECSWLTLKRAVAVLDGMKSEVHLYWAVSGPVRPDGRGAT